MAAISVILSDELDQKVRLYMKASGNNLAIAVRRALDEFVDSEIKNNAGIRSKYERLEASHLASSGVISLVAHRRPRKKLADPGSGLGGK